MAINAGANDCLSNKLYHEVVTAKEDFNKVKHEIEKKIQDFISSRIEWLPINKISLSKENIQVVLNFLEALEEDDDVQYVYATLNVSNDSTDKVKK